MARAWSASDYVSRRNTGFFRKFASKVSVIPAPLVAPASRKLLKDPAIRIEL